MSNKVSNRAMPSRAGFTLPEVLVAVAMVGVLSAVVLPTVLGQMNKSEVSRIIQDLQAVEQAAQTFRADVGRWPGDLEDLISEITIADHSAEPGSTDVFNLSEVGLWRGPYISRTTLNASSGLDSGAGSAVDAVLGKSTATTPLNPSPDAFLYVQVTGITAALAQQVSLEVDGAEVGQDPSLNGRVRWSSPSGTSLYYFPLPFK